ncbi:MAG: enterochelin esterase-like enzyme [Psychromonas sp.]|uniref:alpha/beta hydrolase-fold protein n=1 Tax=Psychromonas sp. TaxID=1884585 RepID=UPI0039E5C56B
MNIKNIFSKGLSVIAGAAFLLALTACSSDRSQASDNCAQVAGTWITEEVIDDTQCGGHGRTENHSYTVSQNNCQVSVAENGAVGVVTGSEIHWPAYAFPNYGGTTEASEETTKVQGQKLASTVRWTWSNEEMECSGTTAMTGYIASKMISTTEDLEKALDGKWTGSWGNNKTESVEIVEINKKNVLFTYYWAADPSIDKAAGSALFRGDRQAGETLAFTWEITDKEKLSFSLNKAHDILTVVYENGFIYGFNEMTQDYNKSIAKKYSSILSPKDGAFEHIFSVQAANAKEVYLAGEMTSWQGNVLKMKKGADGVWVLPLYLEQGAWQYKFVIDGEWHYDKANPVTTDDGYEGYNSIIVLGEENSDAKVTANIPHGSVEKINIQSKALGTNSAFMLYLPPGYSQNTAKNYPVLFLLHGYGNNEEQWTRDGKIQNFMDNYIHEGGIQPFIVVMPFGDTSQYMGKYETHLMNEVRGYVDTHYRVKTGKASTAISGISMGGFGAFYLAHRHQDVFGLTVPLSGYFNMSLYPELGVDGKIAMDSELHFYCGTDDTTSFSLNQALVKRLKENDVDFTYQTAAGGHTWRYWNGISKEFLKVVSDYFNKA